MKRVLLMSVGFLFVLTALIALPSGHAATTCKEPQKIALKSGMKVIAEIAGPNWCVARIESLKGEDITVKYAVGGEDVLNSEEVIPHPSILYKDNSYPCFKKGDKVIAKSNGDIWREATINSVDGDNVNVTFLNKKEVTLKQSELARAPK